MTTEQLKYLNTLSESEMENIIDLAKQKTEQEIKDFLNDDYMLLSEVNKNYTENDNIDYTEIDDDDLIDELGNRSWTDSEAEEIYSYIEEQIQISNYDIYEAIQNLSPRLKQEIIDDLLEDQKQFPCKTLYDELKLDILKDIFQNFTLEQLQQIKNK